MDYYAKKIKEVLEDNIARDKVRHYLMGTIENIPKEVAGGNFILIRPLVATVGVADTQRDFLSGSFEIYVGTDIRNNFDENDYTTAFLTECMDVMDGTDDNGVLKPDSVVGILRSNICTPWINQTSFELDYTNQRDEEYTYTIKLTVEIYGQRNRNN